jgi:glycosyltransferase involved in cell wall biosynthesis
MGVPLRLTIAGRVLNERERAYWERCRVSIAAMPEPIQLIEEFVPEEKLPELFSRCHCLVLPYGAFYSDSGVAYLALANGKPLLATEAGGLGELLKASKGGILISEATVDAVEVAIREASEMEPGQLERMGREGTEWVLRECGWPKVASQTRKLYESALGMRLGAWAFATE